MQTDRKAGKEEVRDIDRQKERDIYSKISRETERQAVYN